MPITVKLFAHYRDLIGTREVTIPSRSGLTVAGGFGETLGDRANGAFRKSAIFAVNEAYVSAETVVNDGDRVAFIPPVSGG